MKIFSQRMNHTPIHKAVCRTALATLGLLMKVDKLTFGNFTNGNITLDCTSRNNQGPFATGKIRQNIKFTAF